MMLIIMIVIPFSLEISSALLENKYLLILHFIDLTSKCNEAQTTNKHHGRIQAVVCGFVKLLL